VGLLVCAAAFGFGLLVEGCLQCLAKSGFENSKSIGMSTMGGEYFGKKHGGHENTKTQGHELFVRKKSGQVWGSCNVEKTPKVRETFGAWVVD
jgi:hypothetical protein